MPEYKRYAIYYAPKPDSVLGVFARQWLGIDAQTGYNNIAPNQYVKTPRKYGFHATLKAPMRLMPEVSLNELTECTEQLANELYSAPLGLLKPTRIGNFIALTVEPVFHPEVSALAWKCVQSLDHLRAPLYEREKRKRTLTNQEEKDNLENWGYPYVGKQFNFHMTLTSALTDAELTSAHEILLESVPLVHNTLDCIAIFGDPGGDLPFQLVKRFELRSAIS